MQWIQYKTVNLLIEYILLYKKHLIFAKARSQKNTNFNIIDQEKHNIEQINIWNSITPALIM